MQLFLQVNLALIVSFVIVRRYFMTPASKRESLPQWWRTLPRGVGYLLLSAIVGLPSILVHDQFEVFGKTITAVLFAAQGALFITGMYVFIKTLKGADDDRDS